MAKWSRERQAWYDAIRNCYNPKRKQYSQYGALGIKVCPEWGASYAQFLKDMGPAPMDRTWLGRLDVRGNYEPANCIWTTREEQENRRAFCRKVTLNGQEMTAAQASRLPGQPCRFTILYRQENGTLSDSPPAKRLFPNSQWITHDGQTLPIYEWARRLGIGQETLRRRINIYRWPIEVALNPELRRGRSPLSTPAPAR